MMISMVATALKGEVSRYGDQNVARGSTHTSAERVLARSKQRGGCESGRGMED